MPSQISAIPSTTPLWNPSSRITPRRSTELPSSSIKNMNKNWEDSSVGCSTKNKYPSPDLRLEVSIKAEMTAAITADKMLLNWILNLLQDPTEIYSSLPSKLSSQNGKLKIQQLFVKSRRSILIKIKNLVLFIRFMNWEEIWFDTTEPIKNWQVIRRG